MRRKDSVQKSKKSRSVEIGGHVGAMDTLEDGAPRYELRVDRDGKWFHEGMEVVREDIRKYFSQHLVQNENGGYCVRVGEDESPVIVEDAPFVVVRVIEKPEGALTLLLSDGGTEPLDVRTLEFKDSNVPYCRVRGGLEARFSRPAYYQLAEFIEYDEATGKYRLAVYGQVTDLKID